MFGPLLDDRGCTFRLWAKADAKIELVLEEDGSSRIIPMACAPSGMFELRVEGVGAGTRYWFKINGAGPFPDPASRYQPQGVHRPSEVFDPRGFSWVGDDFRPPALRDVVIYELHVGVFSPAGTFLSAIEKLDDIQQLGVNAIELMPIADFPGERNWGYDGVSHYAPSHNYGKPDDLRRLIKEAHRRGIAVYLDVVYNHLGPDGAYHAAFAPHFYSKKHKTPWGDGLNFDGEEREKVRAYFVESALQWIVDYHVDGLRLDATQTIQDDSRPHFLTEVTERVHAAGRELGKEILLFAEDARNERKVVLPANQEGHGFDGVWADDFHHSMRRRMAGDCDGYFIDFEGTAAGIAKTIQNGWLFAGEFAGHENGPRGTSAKGLSLESRVICLQNHDQTGNRAFGERLSTQIPRAAYYAASTLLLLAPETPLLFMGQEWAAEHPFLFFADHHEDLGKLVTEGRRKEFEHFASFSDEACRHRIPDPQAKGTYLQSKLDWEVRQSGEHGACLRLYRSLLRIRKTLVGKAEFHSSRALNDEVILLEWTSAQGRLAVIVALEGPTAIVDTAIEKIQPIWSSEDQLYTNDPHPIVTDTAGGRIRFERPGAVVLASGVLIELSPANG